MLRLLALTTIVLASGFSGLSMAKAYLNRPRQLRAFHQALSALKTEISYGATPLPAALATAAEGVEHEVAAFLSEVADRIWRGMTAGAAWLQACDHHRKKLNLTAEDWKMIRAIGVGIGTADREEELKKLNLGCMRLLATEGTADEQGRKLARLWSYMGFLAGAAVALVIW